MSNEIDLFIKRVSTTKDPIEKHILSILFKLKQQNIRLKEHITKSGGWLDLKDVSVWKGFDFYNYFLKKYKEKYGSDYRQRGNSVKAYDRISKFLKENSISNEEYRDFIDLSFSRYFTTAVLPVLGNLCSVSLFSKLMRVDKKRRTQDEFYELDQKIQDEADIFEDEIKEFGEIVYAK